LGFIEELTLKVKSMRVIQQEEIADCGHACLLMIADHFGLKMDLSTYKSEFFISVEGSSFEDLKNNAEQMNLSASGFKVGLSDISSLNVPCIVNFYSEHFVVLEKVTKNFVHIIDPASGPRRIPIALLPPILGGDVLYALEVTKDKGFAIKDLRKKYSLLNYIKLIKGISASYTQVFLFAFIVQLALIAQPFYVQLAMDDVVVNNDMELMLLLLTAFIAVGLFDVMAQFIRESLIINLEKSITKSFYHKLLARVLKLPIEYFHSRSSGTIMQKFDSLSVIVGNISRSITTIILDGILSIIMLVLMFIYSVDLTLIILGIVALYVILKLVTYSVFSKINSVFIHDSSKEKGALIQIITNMTSIKGLSSNSHYLDKFDESVGKRLVTEKKINNWKNTFSSINNVIQHTDTLIVVYIGVVMIANGEFTVGMLYSFIFYKTRFVSSAVGLMDSSIELFLSRVHMKYMADIINTESEEEREKLSESENIVINQSLEHIHDLTKRIEFKDFTYSYPKTKVQVFENFSYVIPANESVCIKGRSGSGKSTILNIISGLYRPQDNQVYINDIDINKTPLNYLRSKISYYTPTEEFFDDSLLSNIAVSKSININKITDILKGLDLYDYILNEVPGGLEGHIGSVKYRFSTGQKRRIMLARALYKDANLLLLDEPTESLDTVTENIVMDYILKTKKRLILVTHKKEVADRFKNIIEL
jgi:ATP-binding cassette subfamily B protein RaxB